MTRDNLAGVRLLLAPKSIAVIGRVSPAGNDWPADRSEPDTSRVQRISVSGEPACRVGLLGSRVSAPSPTFPEPVDLAVVAVPKQYVLAVAEDCGEPGVQGLVVISAGFPRAAREGAARRERARSRSCGAPACGWSGPNCMGVFNADPAVSMNATFAPRMPPFGRVAFVSQSGALGFSVLDYAHEYGIGISQFVSVGNKPDVSGNDLLCMWEHDPTVR